MVAVLAVALVVLWRVAPILAGQGSAPGGAGLSHHSTPKGRPASMRNALAPAGQESPAAGANVPSLLDEVGRLVRRVTPGQVAAWKAELHRGTLSRQQAAQIHLWLGEWTLARKEPEVATWHFEQVARLTPPADPVRGAAAYDTAMSRYYEGAYASSAASFKSLLRSHLRGYAFTNAVLWMRHAGACAGIHRANARLGVPEPPQLDPECAAAGLAASLRALGLSCSRPVLLRAMRVTGEGSNVRDILDAAKRLHVHARVVKADDKGLQHLPLPVIAHVERDHFVAVVRADSSGVSYLCSDCGPWPGGRVNLTWRQWHALNPGLYVTVTRPGSFQDRWLSAVVAGKRPPVRVASAGSLRGLIPAMTALRASMGQILAVLPTTYPGCGYQIEGLHHSCPVMNPMASGGGGAPAGTGDPVNLATGEEEYAPQPDLVVYNPIGPPVEWGRVYNSLRNSVSGGFGHGWSGTYNVWLQFNSYTGTGVITEANGGQTTFSISQAPTADAP